MFLFSCAGHEPPNITKILSQNNIDEDICDGLLYTAPEILRSNLDMEELNIIALQKADTYRYIEISPKNLGPMPHHNILATSEIFFLYSFAIILYELHLQKGPFGITSLLPSQILSLVLEENVKEPFRPDLNDWKIEWGEYVRHVLHDSWVENPYERLDFKVIRARLRPLRKGSIMLLYDFK